MLDETDLDVSTTKSASKRQTTQELLLASSAKLEFALTAVIADEDRTVHDVQFANLLRPHASGAPDEHRCSCCGVEPT